jgi:hypothetical protein
MCISIDSPCEDCPRVARLERLVQKLEAKIYRLFEDTKVSIKEYKEASE